MTNFLFPVLVDLVKYAIEQFLERIKIVKRARIRVIKKELYSGLDRKVRFYLYLIHTDIGTLDANQEVFATLDEGDEVDIKFSQFFSKKEIFWTSKTVDDLQTRISQLLDDEKKIAWKQRTKTIVLLVFLISCYLIYLFTN